jgi:transposase-like protein
MLVQPELTALWERKMTQIEKGELELDAFVSEAAAMIGEIVKAPLDVPEVPELPRKKKCLTEGCNGYLRHISKEKSSFFACPVCGQTFKDEDGEAVQGSPTAVRKKESRRTVRLGAERRRGD